MNFHSSLRREIGSAGGKAGHGRIVFANQLRGIAASFVVLSHLGGVFVLMGPTVGWVISAPEVQVGHPFILHLTSWSWLNFGPLGVAIFFLISGFVIPLSLRSQGPQAFLVARAFRIFPTLWIALLAEWLAVFAQSKLYGRPMAFTPLIYLCNASLLDTITNNGYVDLVNWTLAIEVKFYLLMALLRPWVLRGRVLPLIGFSMLATTVAVAQRHDLIHLPGVLANEPMYIGFMLIGTVFHYRIAGLVSTGRAVGAGTVLLGLFTLCWHEGPSRDLFPVVTVNYFYGLAIFGAAYAARDRFRPVRWLDFLADVSFPLYLIHSVLGYSVMTLAIRVLGFSYMPALAAALAVTISFAWVLHRIVERPSLAFGKRMAGRLPRAS